MLSRLHFVTCARCVHLTAHTQGIGQGRGRFKLWHCVPEAGVCQCTRLGCILRVVALSVSPGLCSYCFPTLHFEKASAFTQTHTHTHTHTPPSVRRTQQGPATIVQVLERRLYTKFVHKRVGRLCFTAAAAPVVSTPQPAPRAFAFIPFHTQACIRREEWGEGVWNPKPTTAQSNFSFRVVLFFFHYKSGSGGGSSHGRQPFYYILAPTATSGGCSPPQRRWDASPLSQFTDSPSPGQRYREADQWEGPAEGTGPHAGYRFGAYRRSTEAFRAILLRRLNVGIVPSMYFSCSFEWDCANASASPLNSLVTEAFSTSSGILHMRVAGVPCDS